VVDLEKYRGKSVLVTGADGFIGSHLAERLAELGAKVTALALYNSFDSHGWLDDVAQDVRQKMKLVRGDVRDDGFTDRLVKGHEIVFHLAALIGIPYSYDAPRSYVDTNIVGTLNMLEAARKHGVARIVHTSTSEVYGTAQRTPIDEAHPLQGQSPYSASKIGADMIAESYARSFGLPVAILRPFNTYGPRQSERAVIPTLIRQALDPRCREIRIGDLSPRRDFTFVRDTVDAFLVLGVADGAEFGIPYNAGSGKASSIGETAALIAGILSCDKAVRSDDGRFRPAHSEVRVLLADHARLTQLTGWAAGTSFASGLRETAQWWRSRLARGLVRPDSDFAR